MRPNNTLLMSGLFGNKNFNQSEKRSSNFKISIAKQKIYAVFASLAFLFLLATNSNAQFANDQPLLAAGDMQLDKNMKNYTTVLKSSQVFVKWTSSQEEEDCVYVIERSLDANDYRAVGVKEGISTSIELFYSWIDKEPPVGYAYYRIKKITKGGGNYYSAVNSVFNTDPGTNPTAKAN